MSMYFVIGKFNILLLLPFVVCVWAKSGEVCFPFGSSEPSIAPPQASQGRPGKIGPRGPPGLSGGVGERGPPGTCSCDPNEIEQLREEIRIRDERIDEIFGVIRSNGNLLCGVGLKDGRVRDEDITASSTHNTNYLPRFARLDRQGVSGAYGGWLGVSRGSRQWLQVDLRKSTRVVAVVTQGLNYPGSAQYWTTSYKISYGNSTTSMQVIQNENGNDLIFDGNTDGDTHVINDFPAPITARYFRLFVQTWHNYGVVRLEYLTC